MRRAQTVRLVPQAALCVGLAFASLRAAESVQKPAVPNDGTPACIAIVLPRVQGVQGSATDAATAARDLLASYLTGPSLRAVALTARLPAQALEEAQQQQCSDVVLSTLTRKRSSGLFSRAMGQAAGAAAWHVPYAAVPSGAVAAGVAAATAQAVSTLAGETRAHDELGFQYRVVSPANAIRIAPTSDKAKANQDGEDLLTPLIERAAQTIAGAVQSAGNRR